MEQTPNTMNPEHAQTSWVALILLVIVALLIAGGAIYLKEMLPKPAYVQDAEKVEALETQSESTDPATIESELNAQSPEEFEAEFDESFAELDAAL